MRSHALFKSRVLVFEKKKLLVIGASGLLGSKLMVQAATKCAVSGSYNPEVDGKSSWRLEPLDVGSKEEVEKLFEKVKPEVVILCAAMTNVDGCQKQPLMANRVNATGPELVARSCKKMDSRLVHVSTDYVFDGAKMRRYTEDDMPRPISVYGSTKLAGEKAVLSTLPDAVVARPAVLYGWNPLEDKDNFVTWVIKKIRKGERATLFEDQWISPTFADDLARTLLDLAGMNVKGVWHVSGPDCLDRPTCGRMIAKAFDLDEKLVAPVPSSSVSLPAKRPKYSCLDVSKVEKLLGRKMMSFEEGLKTMREQEPKKR
jgi:dTDP-4-dehydrorhamnose reductase